MGSGLHLRRWALLLAALIAGAAPFSASAQDTATAQARAAIVRSLSFFSSQDLSFGSIIPGTTAGTVTVAPDGTRTSNGGVILAGSSQQAARFAGRGTYNQTLRIRIEPGAVDLTGPGTRMRVSNFMIGSTPPTELTTAWGQYRIASVFGILDFPVGATLAVNARQAPGVYTGTFRVTLEYQ